METLEIFNKKYNYVGCKKMRKEIKYVIDYSEYKQIQQILEICMKKDINANEKGTYKIKTIYFDNY